MSMKLTPAASTRTSACPAAGDGVGTSASFITSGPPCFSMRIAFMAAFTPRGAAGVKGREGVGASRETLDAGQADRLRAVEAQLVAAAPVPALEPRALDPGAPERVEPLPLLLELAP